MVHVVHMKGNILCAVVSCRSSAAVMEALVQLISEENSVIEVFFVANVRCFFSTILFT